MNAYILAGCGARLHFRTDIICIDLIVGGNKTGRQPGGPPCWPCWAARCGGLGPPALPIWSSSAFYLGFRFAKPFVGFWSLFLLVLPLFCFFLRFLCLFPFGRRGSVQVLAAGRPGLWVPNLQRELPVAPLSSLEPKPGAAPKAGPALR